MTAVERERATYSFGKTDRLVRRDWGFFRETLERWKAEGWDGSYEQFHFDENPYADDLIGLVGIDVPLVPPFAQEVVERTGGYLYVRSPSGGIEKFTDDKTRWDEIMPTYVRHPVESPRDWHEKIKPRLDPDTPARWERLAEHGERVAAEVRRGEKLYQGMGIGGYMYLRAMMGPEGTLLAFYDHPQMVHDMMRTWLHLLSTCLTRLQKSVPFFKFLIGEDISYKCGPLISPLMMEEFLFPYYRELFRALRSGQAEPLHTEVDSDGRMDEVIPLYAAVGFDTFRPFEVAAGSDVVRLGELHPSIVMSGGIDKRVLGQDREAIRRECERIFPAMAKRGGYIPTCDHTVPSTVPYRNYLSYRELVQELDRAP